MTTAVSPPRPRATWRQPRFLLGAALVVASVVGGAGLVAASDRTVEAFAARHALVAGDELAAADLVGVRVRLGSLGAAYLTRMPGPGTLLTRTVAQGELVPVGALGAASAQRQTSVMIAVDGELPAAVVVGAVVDVWSATPTGQSGGGAKFAAPDVLVPSATVVRVVRQSGFGASGGAAVEVRVPKTATAGLLAAIANGAAITVLPAGN